MFLDQKKNHYTVTKNCIFNAFLGGRNHIIIPFMITSHWTFELVDFLCTFTTATSQKLKILVILRETENSNIQVHHACTRLQRLLS